MSKLYISSFIFFLLIFSGIGNTFSQITVNGPRPKTLYRGGGGDFYASLSYGYILWKDSKQREFPGYSQSKADLSVVGGMISDVGFDKFNYGRGIFFGGEKAITDRFFLKSHLFFANMWSGLESRADIESVNKSKFFQLALYSSLSLTRDMDKVLQFQWIAGPEIIYANKDVLIKEYVKEKDAAPEDFHYKETVVEGAIVTGLGVSIRLAEKFTVYSDGLVGLSLPGKGIKVTSNNTGIRYKVR